MPELATSVVGAIRGHSDIALGNVIGSNIFNIGFILGLTSLVLPLHVDERVIHVDMWVMLGTSALIVALSHWNRPIGKIGGIAMLAAFALYIVTVF